MDIKDMLVILVAINYNKTSSLQFIDLQEIVNHYMDINFNMVSLVSSYSINLDNHYHIMVILLYSFNCTSVISNIINNENFKH